MTDEERLQLITDQLIIVRDNLFRGLSKSMQKLQARDINEVLGLENFTESPSREWVGLTDEEMKQVCYETFSYDPYVIAGAIEDKLKEKNT
jgi:hypothetical protein